VHGALKTQWEKLPQARLKAKLTKSGSFRANGPGPRTLTAFTLFSDPELKHWQRQRYQLCTLFLIDNWFFSSLPPLPPLPLCASATWIFFENTFWWRLWNEPTVFYCCHLEFFITPFGITVKQTNSLLPPTILPSRAWILWNHLLQSCWRDFQRCVSKGSWIELNNTYGRFLIFRTHGFGFYCIDWVYSAYIWCFNAYIVNWTK
jgi:hypothetical protein